MTKLEAKQILISASRELARHITKANQDLADKAGCDSLDEPDYHDFQTCDELLLIATELFR